MYVNCLIIVRLCVAICGRVTSSFSQNACTPLQHVCVRLSAAELIHVSGYEGREVKVSCPYGEGYESYEKYLCKNDCGSDDVLITTTEAKKNRYSIHDDKQKRFTVTITSLTQNNSGSYLCGVHGNTGLDVFSAFELEVKGKRSTSSYYCYFSQNVNQSKNTFL
uniref:Immunoglobulin domain-containing protein n=1 Tax=Sander lucioperca TaxID=283035 RepID=A0A8C9WWU2_SANLU